MKIAMLTALLLASLGPRALGAAHDAPQMLGSDPLTHQIVSAIAHGRIGTAVVRVATGQAIKLELADVSSAPFAAALAPAASLATPLKPAPGLAAKPAKTKAKRSKRAVDQLRRAAAAKTLP